MNKLTPEQRDWLIGQMQKDITAWENKYPSGSYAFIKDMFEIINQCTEQEFPETNIDLGGGYYVVIENNESGTFFATYKDGGHRQSTLSFNKEQFKKLVDNCNKVMEWLEKTNE